MAHILGNFYQTGDGIVMLRAPKIASRTPPEETACFIGEGGHVVVLTNVMNKPPHSFDLVGRILTIYDASRVPSRQRFAIGDLAVKALRAGSDLVVAEIDNAGPVRTTSGLARSLMTETIQ